jgi:hypothetical protein
MKCLILGKIKHIMHNNQKYNNKENNNNSEKDGITTERIRREEGEKENQ